MKTEKKIGASFIPPNNIPLNSSVHASESVEITIPGECVGSQ